MLFQTITSVIINVNGPLTPSTWSIIPKFKMSKSEPGGRKLNSVKISIGGKPYKAGKDEYEPTINTDGKMRITFKGDNLAGSWTEK